MWRTLPLVFLAATACTEANPAADAAPEVFWPDAGDAMRDSGSEVGDAERDPDPPDGETAMDAVTDVHDSSADAAFDPPDAADLPPSDAVQDTRDASEDTAEVGPDDTDLGRDGGLEPVPTGCVTEVGGGHHVFPCDAGIEFDLEVPPACLAQSCGIIVDVHGLSMDAAQQDRNTEMRARGREAGYLVIQPTAPIRAWDGGRHDDAVWAFVQDVAAAYHADRGRLHFMGFSQGGDMTLRMLCAHADELASVAPAATNGWDCPELPAAEIPILHIHGTADMTYRFSSAERLRDRFVEHWGFGEPEMFVDAASHRAWRWRTDAGTEYELHAHDFRAESGLLAGHCLPGSPDSSVALPGQLFAYGCVGPNQFNYAELAVAFFRAHPRR
jgi:dienelactone hydrolase